MKRAETSVVLSFFNSVIDDVRAVTVYVGITIPTRVLYAIKIVIIIVAQHESGTKIKKLY